MDQEDMAYTHDGLPLSHEKECNLPRAAAQMHSEGIVLNDLRQRKTSIIWHHLHVGSEKYIKLVTTTKQQQTPR